MKIVNGHLVLAKAGSLIEINIQTGKICANILISMEAKKSGLMPFITIL